MMGKRITQSNKTRIVGKGFESGKPESPSMSTYAKPIKLPPSEKTMRVRESPALPYVKVQDNDSALPRFTAVASRAAEDGISMDELDVLQLELENLLCNAAVRTRVLRNEIENIDVNESKREKKGKAAGKQLHYPGKRKHQEDKPAKAKEIVKLPQSHAKIPKLKNLSPAITPIPPQGSFSNDNILVTDNNIKLEMTSVSSQPKNNTPYKFWLSVEPYCAPITMDDVKYVESVFTTSSNVLPPPIPPLGKHYSDVWADENLSDEQSASNPNKHKNSSDASSLRKKSEKFVDGMISGPLTQRLVSALLEDDAIKFEMPDMKMKPGSQKAPSFRNSLTLEKCLRKELIEQGILDPEDLPPLMNPADDDILTDIKKCLSELAIIRKTNVRNLRNLLLLCKQELVRNDLKKKLEQVDSELTEMYKKHIIAKQKKRPLTKKEKDDAWKLINEQTRLNNEINALPTTGPNS